MGVGIALQFIKKFWPHILIGIIFLSVFAYWKNLQNTIIELNKEKESLVEQRDIWKGNYTSLNTALTEQKVLLEAVASKTETLKGDFTQLQGNIKTQVSTISGSLRNINKVDLSKLSCDQAIDYLRQSAAVIPNRRPVKSPPNPTSVTTIPTLSPADIKELQK